MKNLWITYAWKDNEDKDIDFIIQELDSKTNINVKFDRRNLIPGQRLWEQIGESITNPDKCDAWAIVLTPNSINSEKCIEELSYALERALQSKGPEFPMFALFHNISPNELPPSLKIRLSISLENSSWIENVVAAAEKKPPGFSPSGIEPWITREYVNNEDIVLEIRPRIARITPFVVAVDKKQKIDGNVSRCRPGPANRDPSSTLGFCAFNSFEGPDTLKDGTEVWLWEASNEASPTSSYYLFFKRRPPRIWVGQRNNLERIF